MIPSPLSIPHQNKPRHSTRSPTCAKNPIKLSAINGIEHPMLPQPCKYQLNKRNKANPKHLRTLAAMLTPPSGTQQSPSFPSQVVRYFRIAQTPHITPPPLPISTLTTDPDPRSHEPKTIPPTQQVAQETTTTPLTSSHPTSHRISDNQTTIQPLSTISKNTRRNRRRNQEAAPRRSPPGYIPHTLFLAQLITARFLDARLLSQITRYRKHKTTQVPYHTTHSPTYTARHMPTAEIPHTNTNQTPRLHICLPLKICKVMLVHSTARTTFITIKRMCPTAPPIHFT